MIPVNYDHRDLAAAIKDKKAHMWFSMASSMYKVSKAANKAPILYTGIQKRDNIDG